MPRYIDADALMKEFRDFVRDSNNSDFAPIPNWNDAVSLVGSAPTIDAVEVVRCKDCVWHGEKYCNNFNVWGFKDNDYCSLGRRRETEDGEIH